MKQAVPAILIATVFFMAVCVFGGFMLLVALNGFSEQEALPFLVIYFILSLAAISGAGTLAGWLFTKNMPEDTRPRMWALLGLSILFPLLAIGCFVAERTIRFLF